MLSIQSIQLMAGSKPLLEKASLTLYPGQKVGLIGQNGAGKSTLFKAILNEVPLEAGAIELPSAWLVGHVTQEIETLYFPALDYVMSGDSVYYKVKQSIEKAELEDNHPALVKAYDELDCIQGYDVPIKAQQLLFGLGFVESDFIKPVSSFSGGWQVRLKLASALMQRSDLLLLDEPTNHLDIEAVYWLIQWLKGFSGALMVISHDRFFLDEVVTGIAQIDQGSLNYFAGNFAAFERQRNEQLMQQQALHDKQKQQMQHLKSFIDRFKAKASKAKQAQSRVKALQRMESVAAVQASNPFQFSFFPSEHLPDPVLQTEGLTVGYEAEEPILSDVDLVLRAGDRIGLVGVNGSGKSTLLKALIKELKALSGKLIESKGVKIGYFAQHQLESLVLEHSPLQHLLALSKFQPVTDQEARSFLGQFGFSHEKAIGSIVNFSGGEKARLSLALMIFLKPNLIILDEPTNHLDMETRDALEMALQDFEGALILVSHDQYLLSSLVDQFWWVHQRKVSFLNGSLEEYLQNRVKLLKTQQLEVKAQKKLEKSAKTTRPGQQEVDHNKKSQRQENAQFRKLMLDATRQQTQALTQVEKLLSDSQHQLLELHQKMADSSLYESKRSAELTDLLKHEAKLKQKIEEAEENWLFLEEEIEAIKADVLP